MKIRNILFFILLNLTLINAYALDPMAKEETTPPAAEGAITAEQIPPLFSSKKPANPPSEKNIKN